MTSNCGKLVRISAALAVGDSSYVPVYTRHGVAEVKEDWVVEGNTGFMFCRLCKSVCKKVQTTKTYQLPHMMLKQYQGELHLVPTLNTTAKDIQHQIE